MEGRSNLTVATLITACCLLRRPSRLLSCPAPSPLRSRGRPWTSPLSHAERKEAPSPRAWPHLNLQKAQLKSARTCSVSTATGQLRLQGNVERQEPHWPRPHFLSTEGGFPLAVGAPPTWSCETLISQPLPSRSVSPLHRGYLRTVRRVQRSTLNVLKTSGRKEV